MDVSIDIVSEEKEHAQRYILRNHADLVKHLFCTMQEHADAQGWCMKLQRQYNLDVPIDLLVGGLTCLSVGPSIRSISMRLFLVLYRDLLTKCLVIGP